MSKLGAVVGFALVATAGARRFPGPGNRVVLPQLHHAQVASIPMTMYKEDCWQKQRTHRLALSQIPGAGMDPEGFKPFETVLKDGFFAVDCLKDYVLIHGDAFGDGRHDYKLGETANVSVVHYTDIVAREDQKPMTPEVCFSFCRTVPDMPFFGIHNGRDCYCSPYFKAMAGDSSDCDAPCDGNPTQVCGGKLKSSIFSMHSCADTGKNMKDASTTATTMEQTLLTAIGSVKTLSTDMTAVAEPLQKAFGSNGVPSASNLMQSAKVHAGKLETAAKDAETLKSKITGTVTEAGLLDGKDFTKMAEAKKAETVTNTLTKLTTQAESTIEDLDDLAEDSNATGKGNATQAALLYYPLMYFVDKKFKNASSICTGDAVKNPMFAASVGECASACEVEFDTCVGFSFAQGVSDQGLCFLFSKVEEVTYFPTCQSTTFLQTRAAASEVACMAKFSRFEGTTVKPDSSGKCKNCLKEATKSSWCPTA